MKDNELIKNKIMQKEYFRVKVRPGAPKSEIKSVLDDETIKIDIAAASEKGKANNELIKFLSKELGVSKDSVSIISGAGDRLKLVKIKK